MADARINNHAGFIWSVADLLRGDYKQSDYGKVIPPLVVLRRLDPADRLASLKYRSAIEDYLAAEVLPYVADAWVGHANTNIVDFVVDFADDADSRFDAYFGLKQALDQRLGRPVDLVSADALSKPHFAASVERNSEELYAA